MFTSKIIGKMSQFRGTTIPDSNGVMPFFCTVIAGKCPNRQTISGTVAKQQGFELDKTYLIQVREVGFHDIHGPQYDFIKLVELTGKDIIDVSESLGDPQVFIVEKPDASKDYERKGDKIVGLRTREEQEGVFHKSTPSTVVENTETAKDVKVGKNVQESIKKDESILAGQGGKSVKKDFLEE